MIRYTLVVLAILATAATAIAAAGPQSLVAASAHKTNVTTVYKDSPFPVIGPITVEQCAVEDCSDVSN